MDALTSTFKAVFALAFVLGLILALAYVLKRYAPQLMAQLQAKRGHRRLQVVETLVLDPARRLVLVRLDEEERLILLGEGHELIEPRPKHAEMKPAVTKHTEPVAAMPVVQPAPKPTPQPVAQSAPPPSHRPAPAPQPVPQPAQAPARPQPVPAATPQDPNDDLF